MSMMNLFGRAKPEEPKVAPSEQLKQSTQGAMVQLEKQVDDLNRQIAAWQKQVDQVELQVITLKGKGKIHDARQVFEIKKQKEALIATARNSIQTLVGQQTTVINSVTMSTTVLTMKEVNETMKSSSVQSGFNPDDLQDALQDNKEMNRDVNRMTNRMAKSLPGSSATRKKELDAEFDQIGLSAPLATGVAYDPFEPVSTTTTTTQNANPVQVGRIIHNRQKEKANLFDAY